MNDWTELRLLTELATPGPWSSADRDGCHAIEGPCGEVVCPDVGHVHDAEFIAAAHPNAILLLLAENARLREREHDLQASVKYWFHGYGEVERRLHEVAVACATAEQERDQFQRDADLYRQWFNAVQDLSPAYLEPADYIAAKALYERLNLRMPSSIRERCDD